MKGIHLYPLILLLSSCSFQQTSTPEQKLFEKVQSAILTQDMNKLSELEYDKIASYISEGKVRWIALYPVFKNKPFVGMTSFQEGLNISMADALSINPVETLKFVDKHNVDEICGIPFIEPTNDEIYSYYTKTRTVLMAHGSESLWGAECLSVLDKTMHDIKTSHSDEN